MSQSLCRKPSPRVMMEVMLMSSKGFPLYAFLALALKTLLFMSQRTSLVAMRMLVEPVIQTDSTQKRRLMGFYELQTLTPVMWHRSRKRAYLQTSLMFQTRMSIFGLTSPNFKVTQRLMGWVTLSPTTQKWLICSYNLGFSWMTGGQQLILMHFFIHSVLNFSISALLAMQDNLKPTLLQLMLPANSSKASPYPKLNRQSTSGMTMETILSFSFFHRLLAWSGLPMMMCLFSICPTSCMQRLTMGILVSDERVWCSCCERSLECERKMRIPYYQLMNFLRASRVSPMVLPLSSGAVMMRLCRSLSISRSCCWKSVGTVIFNLARPFETEEQSVKKSAICFYAYISVVDHDQIIICHRLYQNNQQHHTEEGVYLGKCRLQWYGIIGGKYGRLGLSGHVIYFLKMGLQNTVRVSIRPTILCLFLTLLSVHCSDSLLKGQISFYASNQIAQLRPLTQQPRIANIKNSLFQFVVIPQKDSCFPLNKSQFQRDTNQPPVIAVMDLTDGRITCGMSNKIARIKQAGGYGFIIVTNDNSFVVNHCKMYDSNSFFTGVMNSENYKILSSQTSTPLVGSLTITPIDNKKKLLEIWTSSLSTASYDELRMLNHVFNKLPTLSQHVEFRVRVALLGCTHGDNPNICSVADNVASCGCRGEFCSPQAHKKAPEVIIKQDIRQMHIFKQDNSKFFPYIKLFQEQCLSKYIESSYSHDCAVNVMNKLEIDSYSVNDEVQSFLDKCSDDKEVKVASQTWIYTSLERDKNAFANYGRYPLILLNKQILEYKNEDDLAGQLCRKMSLQDEGCYQVSSRTVTTVTGMLFYVLLVVILVAIGAGVVYFYRKKLKRDMNKEIKMQVSTAVEHYFALTDVK